MAVYNLPYTTAPFVGRTSELDEITSRLNIPGCRLLTLVGPGGIGKTRLAMQAATNCAEQFDDGVYFIPLQPVDSAELIVSAIADGIKMIFIPGADPQEQLFQYLQEKSLLLVLDNFEHLLASAELLATLLATAPELKLLVTSREVLNLREEWLYPIRGLEYPETDDSGQAKAYSAVQLFLERAHQVSGGLTSSDEQAGVIRVCRLVEGMPLALELAAAWTKTLSAGEIASEIKRNLDFLSTSLRNIPQRHHSIQAVFEQTWETMTNEEQRVFRALAVFNGGFWREAAEAITGVSLRILTTLVDKSLLTREPGGRYQIHELLRQFAQTRPGTNTDEVTHIHALHAAYYARFLHERDGDLNGRRQLAALQEIKQDTGNIRAAWLWSVEHSRIENIDRSAHPVSLFLLFQSRFVEAINAFERAAQMLDNGDPRAEIPLAKVLCELGWMYARRGVVKKTQAVAERSWQLYRQNATLPTPGLGSDPRLLLGSLAMLLDGDLDGAEQIIRESFEDQVQRDDRHTLSQICILLTTVAMYRGKYDDARQHIRQGYEYTLTTGDLFTGSYCLQEWGAISHLLGDTADAKRRLQAAYAIHKDFGDLNGMLFTLQRQGEIALFEGDPVEARRYFEQALAICQDLGDIRSLAEALHNIGNSALAQAHFGEARRYLHEALQIIFQHEYLAYQMPLYFVPIGELFLHTGRRERGVELLSLALRIPALEHRLKERAQRLLTQYQVQPDATQPELTQSEYEAVAGALLDALEAPEPSPVSLDTPQADETLIEPLSEREFEVLTLIADGLSNRQIAEQRFLSVATVKWYLTHIYSKLGVQSRTQALVRARQLNLVS